MLRTTSSVAVLLLDLLGDSATFGYDQTVSPNETFRWSCSLASERRLECRNLFNFYLSSYSLCANDWRIFEREQIDDLLIANDYHCFDRSYACYFQFDSTWSYCFQSLKKLTIENLSFVVRLSNDRRLLPIDYLKIVNCHGSVTEFLHLFQFSNRSSIYINNVYPRWSGMDLYSIYQQYSSVLLKQLWINVFDWYPIAYMRNEQQLRVRQWLISIPCLHIELGDCRSYHYDMIFLRDLFGVREELSNELYCYQNHGSERYHWSKLPQFYYNYRIPPRPIVRRFQLTELHEQCFNQFTRTRYAVNSYGDLNALYAYFQRSESTSIPLRTDFRPSTLPNYPFDSTTLATTLVTAQRPSSYPSTLDYINIYRFASLFNETRWLSSIQAFPDGRFLLVDNRNQEFLLLNENGSYRIDLTPIYLHQIRNLPSTRNASTIHTSYAFSHVHIDQEGYVYLISTLGYHIYIFSQENRLVRCLTPRYLGIPIIRSDCLAVSHTGLLYVCDDAHRSVRIYTRMGVAQRILRLDYLPLKLFVSNTRIFTYSMEALGRIQLYTLAGTPVSSFTRCGFNLLSEVLWFRGKYFLTCGVDLFVIDEQGEFIAEHRFHTLLEPSSTNSIVTIHDFALNKNGQLLLTVRRNGTLVNRYWSFRPSTF